MVRIVNSIADKRMGDRSKEVFLMFSSILTQKWWIGIVAGVFGVLGVGAALVAMPAFADAGGSPDLATPGEVEVRLECKQGTWSDGSFKWTLAGKPVGSPVALPTCPDGRRRTVTLPNMNTIYVASNEAGTTSGTGAATADGFRIHVSGKSKPGGTTAECTFPSPNLDSREPRQRHVTFTCTADGAVGDGDAHMKIKVRWIGRGDADQRGPFESRNEPQGAKPNEENEDENRPGQSQDKGNPGKSEEKGENRSWLNPFSRGRGR